MSQVEPSIRPVPGPGYDGLTAAARDGLSEGVVRIDSTGTVIEGNRAAAEILAVAPSAMRGRNFFKDLAPSTNVPRAYGRFLASVRGHGFETEGTFAFDQEPRPVRADLRIASGGEPGTHWVSMVPVDAKATVDPTSRPALAPFGPVDPSSCEREPIHIPGSIQPDASLLVADGDLRIVAHSEHVGRNLHRQDVPLIGLGLDAVLPSAYVARIRSALTGDGLSTGSVVSQTIRLPDANGEPFLAACHAHAGRILVEMEPIPERPEDFGPERIVGTGIAVTRLRKADTIAEVASTAAREIRAITGFECVLIYKFDPDWNGEAIAEDKTDDWSRSLLGLHFPASDIPAQARALYLRSRSRFVTDRDAAPVPLIGDPSLADAPVDLTYAQHRSLSPIHLEYQRNLGVNGSMSASIIVAGVLWGLVIGHHRRPHYVTPDMRAVATLLTDAFAMRIQEAEGQSVWDAQQHHLAVEGRLVRKLTQSDDFVEALTHGETTILDMFSSPGAAVVSCGRATLLGTTPDEASVLALAGWLRETRPHGEPAFITNSLSTQYPEAERFADTASGVLSVFVDEALDHLLLWFKPEVPNTVSWGGDPRKPIEPGQGTLSILPRRSFERWVEVRRRLSLPWADWKVSFATSLGQVVEGVALKQRRRIDELTTLLADKERLLDQKDILSREIDHRVKNSLQIVSAFLQMQERQTKDEDARKAFAETSARVISIARVHDSLYQSENIEDVDLGQTFEGLSRDLSGMARDGQSIAISSEERVMVPYRTAIALSLIATELVTNSLKYAVSPTGGTRIEISLKAGDGSVRMRVCDDGPGLPPDWATRPARGTGLGMKLVKAMLTQVDARMDVDNAPGACFTVHA